MTDRHYVCDRKELANGEREIVSVNGVSIGVFKVDGNFFALLNRCAHQYGEVCEGKIKNDIVAEFRASGERPEKKLGRDKTISCPLHGWEYDIKTGEHKGDSEFSIPTYDVAVEEDGIYIEL